MSSTTNRGRQEIRLASKSGGMFDWVGGLFFKRPEHVINEHQYYPGYSAFYDACEPIYGQNVDFNPVSECGTGYTPGTPLVYDGITINKDQVYVGDFQTQFKDLAAFGERTWHITPSELGLDRRHARLQATLTQAQQTGLFDTNEALFGPVLPITNLSLSDHLAASALEGQHVVQAHENNLVYATWSQGFRRGSVNAMPLSEPAEG